MIFAEPCQRRFYLSNGSQDAKSLYGVCSYPIRDDGSAVAEIVRIAKDGSGSAPVLIYDKNVPPVVYRTGDPALYVIPGDEVISDGTTLYFNYGTISGDLWSMPATGGTPKPITAGPSQGCCEDLAMAGSTIFYRVRSSASEGSIFALPKEGGIPSLVASGASLFGDMEEAVSIGGSLYWRSVEAPLGLFTVPMTGGGPSPISSYYLGGYVGRVAPLNGYLYFGGIANSDLMLEAAPVAGDGGAPTVVAKVPFPGQAYNFVSSNSTSVFMMAASGTATRDGKIYRCP